MKLVSVYKTPSPPFPLAIIMSCHVRPMNCIIDILHHNQLVYNVLDHKNSDMRFLTEDIGPLGPIVLEYFLANEHKMDELRAAFEQEMSALLEDLQVLSLPKQFAPMSNEQLADWLEEIVPRYFSGPFLVEPPGFALELSGHELVREMLRSDLAAAGWMIRGSQPGEKLLTQSQFDELSATLANFVGLSFVQRAELSLMRIALLEESKRGAAIEKHHEAYYWLHHDYYGPVLSIEDIEEEVSQMLQLGTDELERRVTELEVVAERGTNRIKEMESQYELSPRTQRAFAILRFMGQLYSDIKKEYMSPVNVAFTYFINEVAKRVEMDEFVLRFLQVDELIAALRGEAVDQGELERRMNSSVQVARLGHDYYEYVSSEEELDVLQAIQQEKAGSVGAQMKGMPAQSGYYTGTVKVVTNASQISKVKEGDVLVAPMTTVNYIPAMKRAGAILTDIGGITSHAAIVSRELQTPCIVGLGNVTEVLHDGDVVEVNAKHGMVKKKNT